MSRVRSMAHNRRSDGRRWPKSALIGGYIAVFAAIVSAYYSPATGYELSIYGATPQIVWGGLGVAIVVSLLVGLTTRSRSVCYAAIILGGLGFLTVVGLPVIRGYHFYGSADSLTHLGFAKEWLAGGTSPWGLIYPGTHLIAVFLGETSGAGLKWGFMLMVVAFFLVYLVFVPLTARALSGNHRSAVIGVFTAGLFLPVNNVSVFPVPHPTTQAIMFLPFSLYLAMNYLARPVSQRSRMPRGLGGLLAIGSVAMVLIHPQQAVNLFLLFVTIAGLQLLAHRRWLGPMRRFIRTDIAMLRSFVTQTAFLGVVFVSWSSRTPRVGNTITALVGALTGVAPVGDDITTRGASLAALGGSLAELFVKLFLPSLVLSIVAAVLILAAATDRLPAPPRHRNPLTLGLGVALVPLFGLFLFYFFASATTQHFRQVGFVMAIVSVLATVACGYGFSRLTVLRRATVVRFAVAVLVLGLIPLSIATVHSSPFIYQENSMVTEAEFTGYASAFEHRDPVIGYSEPRSGPTRYVDAVYGRPPEGFAFPGRRSAIPEAVFNGGSYPEFFGADRYVIITAEDRIREAQLYQGFRYSEAGFERMNADPTIIRIQANGEFELYLVVE